jgi:hypothetical protein
MPELVAGVRPFRAAVLASALVHLAALLLLQDLWVEERAATVVRVRLMPMIRFVPPRLIGTGQLTAPQAAGRGLTLAPDRLYSDAGPGPGVRVGEGLGLGGQLPQMGQPGAAPGPPLALRGYDPGAKADAPVLERVTMVPPGRHRPAESSWLPPTMDLLRIEDMARAGDKHAVVIADPNSRRDLTGFIKLTRILVYGAGTGRGVGLDALARFARDHSHLLVRVNGDAQEYFVSAELLKDPIIFLFMGGGFEPYDDEVMTHFSEEEKAYLKAYLEAGGFLYIEATNTTVGHRFLREMVGHLQAILGADGELVPLAADHPLYSAYYEFDDGFPGEEGKVADANPQLSWKWIYPAEAAETVGGGGAGLPIDPRLVQTQEENARPLGLWGVRSRGRTVAILSDIDLHAGWGHSYDDQALEGMEHSATGALAAGLNILVYALTREGTLTPQLQRPAWMATRPQAPVSELQPDGFGEPAPGSQPGAQREAQLDTELDPELLAALDASLAVVRVPLGTTGEGRPLRLRLNGVYSLELPRTSGHGVMLHNLPAGRHWLEVRFAGSTRQIALDLPGGRVTTVTFGVSRFAFVRQLRLDVEERRVRLDEWPDAFGDLQLEEYFLGDDRDLVDSAAQLLRQ